MSREVNKNLAKKNPNSNKGKKDKGLFSICTTPKVS